MGGGGGVLYTWRSDCAFSDRDHASVVLIRNRIGPSTPINKKKELERATFKLRCLRALSGITINTRSVRITNPLKS